MIHFVYLKMCRPEYEWMYKMNNIFKNVDFIWLNDREIKHVTNLHNFKTKEEFMNSRPFARVTTLIISFVTNSDY